MRLKIDRKIEDSMNWEFGLIAPEDNDMSALTINRKLFMKTFFIIFVVIISIFFIRILFLNFGVLDYNRKAEFNYKRTLNELSLRGIVYDRYGTKLVRNIPISHAAIIPADIPKDKVSRDKIFEQLSEILKVDTTSLYEIYEKFRFTFHPVILKRNIDHDTGIAIETVFAEYPSIFVKRDYNRDYLFGSNYSHILGYLGSIEPDKFKNNTSGYLNDSLVGKVGIEAYYEDSLRGKDGKRVIYVNSLGKLDSEISRINPESGTDLHITIDNNLQQNVYKALEKGIKRAKSTAGTAIVLNPKNGEILAMVSLPDFDPNIFSKPLTNNEWSALSSNQSFPFLNRSISGSYPPGSIFKLITSTAVLEEGIVTDTQKIDAPAFLSIIDKFDSNKTYIHKDWNSYGHGKIDIMSALAQSSDTFFYTVAGGYEDFKGLGIEKLVEYCKRFKVGEFSDIDLTGETSGLLPDPSWKKENRGAGWFTGDTYNMSIGQGYLLFTPLQIADLTMIVANGGSMYKPHLKQGDAELLADLTEFGKSFDTIRKGMRLSIEDKKGTGKALKYEDFEVAGKTSTAQFEKGKREHAWFTAFAPYEDPEIVVTVLIEEAGEGGTYSLPVVQEIMRGYFD